MLNVNSIRLTGANIEIMKTEQPSEVNVNINIDSIKVKKDEASVEFTYSIDYTPEVAKCTVTGTVSCTDTPPNLKKLVSNWKKKVLPPELGTNVINVINANVGVNAVFLTRPFNLLPPFMPPVAAEAEKK